jgi:hypothetical protein
LLLCVSALMNQLVQNVTRREHHRLALRATGIFTETLGSDNKSSREHNNNSDSYTAPNNYQLYRSATLDVPHWMVVFFFASQVKQQPQPQQMRSYNPV